MTAKKDWSWCDNKTPVVNIAVSSTSPSDLVRFQDLVYGKSSKVYRAFPTRKDKVARHRALFGEPYGVFQGSCRNWVWRLSKDFSVWVSTEGISVEVDRSLSPNLALDLWETYLDQVLLDVPGGPVLLWDPWTTQTAR